MIMNWIDYALSEPKTKEEIIEKIKNDGYSFPHYLKRKRGVRKLISVQSIERDCKRIGIELSEVYPLQTTLF